MVCNIDLRTADNRKMEAIIMAELWKAAKHSLGLVMPRGNTTQVSQMTSRHPLRLAREHHSAFESSRTTQLQLVPGYQSIAIGCFFGLVTSISMFWQYHWTAVALFYDLILCYTVSR